MLFKVFRESIRTQVSLAKFHRSLGTWSFTLHFHVGIEPMNVVWATKAGRGGNLQLRQENSCFRPLDSLRNVIFLISPVLPIPVPKVCAQVWTEPVFCGRLGGEGIAKFSCSFSDGARVIPTAPVCFCEKQSCKCICALLHGGGGGGGISFPALMSCCFCRWWTVPCPWSGSTRPKTGSTSPS